MTDFTDLIDRYFAVWNEGDGERRRALIARTFTEDASYLDPVMQSDGAAAIHAMVAAVQQRFPGHRFRRNGAVDGHHDRVRFAWELAPDAGEAVAAGIDFATTAGTRLASVTGFIDRMPA